MKLLHQTSSSGFFYINRDGEKTFLYHRLVQQPLKTMKLAPSAILFDMDGVLVDSLNAWWKALNNALQMFNHQEITREEFMTTYWGHDLKANLKRLHLNPDVARFCNITYGNHLDSVAIYPETEQMLKSLTRYKKAVITNTPSDCTQQILQKFHIDQYFDVIVTSDDVVKSKPDPEIVFQACKQLKVDVRTVLLVGDTQSDIDAGKAAGCKVIGLRIPADMSIQNLSELPSLLR